LSHLLALPLQLFFQSFVQILENDSFSPQTIDLLSQTLIRINSLIKLLTSLLKATLQNLDLLSDLGISILLATHSDLPSLLIEELLLKVFDILVHPIL